ncbi:MAG TPA: hypothetical protein VE951_05235 [Candidatus Angelobacter sp.]|nr:hypothetical protein [Candidatus Angelobacter sp.]
MIRSDPPLVQLDSGSEPVPISGPIEGSAGRATGRPVPKEVEGAGMTGSAARTDGFGAALRVVVRALAAGRFAAVRFAGAFLAPARFAVERLAVVRFAVAFLPPARFAVERLAVDFLVDFFFAAICPPLGCAIGLAQSDSTADDARCYCRFIASASRNYKRDARLGTVRDWFNARSASREQQHTGRRARDRP